MALSCTSSNCCSCRSVMRGGTL